MGFLLPDTPSEGSNTRAIAGFRVSYDTPLPSFGNRDGGYTPIPPIDFVFVMPSNPKFRTKI